MQTPGDRKASSSRHFSFGDNLYVSKLYQAIMAVPGSNQRRSLGSRGKAQRRSKVETDANAARFLQVGVDQVVRLENDRNFREWHAYNSVERSRVMNADCQLPPPTRRML